MAPALQSAMILLVLLVSSGMPWQEASALEMNGTATLKACAMSGENSYRTTYDEGMSKLKWPIDLLAPGVTLSATDHDLFEVELGIMASPWSSDCGDMKDLDYIDETDYTGRPNHDGVDIFSRSALEAKALVFSLHSRVLPLRSRFFSAGLSAGYRYEEYDYRAYDTSQVGYGPWQDQTSSVSGPTSFYSVDYDILSLGIVMRTAFEDAMMVTFEASYLPLVYASDEDEHLKRNRVSYADTKGSGYQTSMTADIGISPSWFITSEFSFRRITTDGHQDQYWYGDDPATPRFNDTGSRLMGISTDITQERLVICAGLTRRF